MIQTLAREYAQRVKTNLNEDMDYARCIAQSFEAYRNIPSSNRKNIHNSILKSISQNNPNFISVWATFQFYAIDSTWKHEYGRERYTFYRENGEIKYLEDQLDLEGFNTSGLYYNIYKQAEEIVTDPYFIHIIIVKQIRYLKQVCVHL
ncbi:MAG: hypothetical protein HC905_25695 [Bacteroidales bacterium]|nr:hypothetical protein [Bacteroidales bacterium]